MQPAQWVHLKYPVWVIGEAVHWTLQDTYYIRPHYRDMESKQLYLIHRSKHREPAKMRTQRNMAQMKEQIKTPEKELIKMEISNLSDAEFKPLVIKMFKELSEDLSSIKKTQSDTKDTLIEIKNNLQGNNSRMDEAENQINNIELKEGKNNHSEEQETKIQNNEDSISSFWDNFKKSNIRITGVPEGKEKEQEIGKIFENK